MKNKLIKHIIQEAKDNFGKIPVIPKSLTKDAILFLNNLQESEKDINIQIDALNEELASTENSIYHLKRMLGQY